MTAGEVAPLEVTGVSARFGGLLALSDVSLRVPAQGIVGLIGPNGAGKTTLFNCVTGVMSPSAGRVLLFGHEVSGWPPHRRARLGVGRTFQRLELFTSLTVKENLVVGYEAHVSRGGLISDLFALPASVDTRAAAEERAASVLERVGLAEYAGTRAGDLPVGLSRVLELARALCTDPTLLLLDEPSAGLSLEESQRLSRLLRALRDEEGKSLLVVEHDMAFVLGLCERVYVLDFGRLLAEGAPAEIRRNEGVQAAYLGEELEHAGAARG